MGWTAHASVTKDGLELIATLPRAIAAYTTMPVIATRDPTAELDRAVVAFPDQANLCRQPLLQLLLSKPNQIQLQIQMHVDQDMQCKMNLARYVLMEHTLTWMVQNA